VTHQQSFQSLHTPLSRYQRIGGRYHGPQTQSKRKAFPHHKLNMNNVPPVTVIIADSPSNEDVIIKVSDEGGGIPRSQIDQIWSYLFTTADNNVQENILQAAPVPAATPSSSDDGTSSTAALSKSPILAGLGFGLPMSRAYTRYFGGDLDLISLEGYGTDAYVYLVRLGERKDEYA